MKFEEAIKIAGKEYIQDFLRQEHKEVRLPIGFRIKMWWMFQCNKYVPCSTVLNKNKIR